MTKSMKEILESSMSSYTGSEETKRIVSDQIKSRWGETELKNMDCYHNIRTFASWVKLGFKVRKGEKALRSITYVEKKDPEGNITKYRHPVFLFYYRQVEQIKHV